MYVICVFAMYSRLPATGLSRLPVPRADFPFAVACDFLRFPQPRRYVVVHLGLCPGYDGNDAGPHPSLDSDSGSDSTKGRGFNG
jgi:hypothetical protein